MFNCCRRGNGALFKMLKERNDEALEHEFIPLLNSGRVNLKLADRDGKTVLFYASCPNFLMHPACVTLLVAMIEHGASIRQWQCNAGSENILLWSIRYGYYELANLVVETFKIKLNQCDHQGNGVWHLLAERQNSPKGLCEKLFNTSADERGLPSVNEQRELDLENPLMLAARTNNVAMFQFFMDCNARLDLVNRDGKSVLHIIADGDRVHLLKIVIEKAPQQGNEIINWQDKHENTVLMTAALKDSIESLALVLTSFKGVDVHVTNRWGDSALSCANDNDHTDCAELLRKHGSVDESVLSPVKEKYSKDSPLCDAITTGNVEDVRLLVKHDKSVREKHVDGQTQLLHHVIRCTDDQEKSLEVLRLLQREGYDINGPNARGSTPIIFAVQQSNMSVLRHLIHDGLGKVNARGRGGNTALHYACSDGNTEAVKLLCLDGHADVNIQSDDGWTPLMWAAYTKNVELLKILLKYGGDTIELWLQNKFGRTALDEALKRKLDDNAAALQNHARQYENGAQLELCKK
eukprot:g2731.t1